jgi:hypothetical protein
VAKVDDPGEFVLVGGSKISETDTRLMNNIAARSCCALKSRGSRTSRKIKISESIAALPNQKAFFRINFLLQSNRVLLICDSPAFEGEGRGDWSDPCSTV